LLIWLIFNLSFDVERRIQNGWIEACGNQKVILPKKALAEFTKRLQLSASEDDKANKAKLNFSKCGLDDKMVRI
jgi:hypothetical protein